MKKILLSVAVFSMLPVCAFELPTVPINELSPYHEMQSMEAARFRHEQIDYYNDVKTEKERFKKRNAQPTAELKEQINQAVQKSNVQNSKSEFIRENGQLNIKYGK